MAQPVQVDSRRGPHHCELKGHEIDTISRWPHWDPMVRIGAGAEWFRSDPWSGNQFGVASTASPGNAAPSIRRVLETLGWVIGQVEVIVSPARGGLGFNPESVSIEWLSSRTFTPDS